MNRHKPLIVNIVETPFELSHSTSKSEVQLYPGVYGVYRACCKGKEVVIGRKDD